MPTRTLEQTTIEVSNESGSLNTAQILDFAKKTTLTQTDVSLEILLERNNAKRTATPVDWGVLFSTNHYFMIWPERGATLLFGRGKEKRDE